MAFLAFWTSSGPVEAVSFLKNIAAAQALIGANHDFFAAGGFFNVLKMGKHLALLDGQLCGKIERGPFAVLQKFD